MVDISFFRVWTNHYSRYAQAVAIDIDMRWHNVIVETTPIIPGEEDCCTIPVWPLHNHIDKICDICLACAYQGRRMLTRLAIRSNPRYRRQRTIFSRGIECESCWILPSSPS